MYDDIIQIMYGDYHLLGGGTYGLFVNGIVDVHEKQFKVVDV